MRGENVRRHYGGRQQSFGLLGALDPRRAESLPSLGISEPPDQRQVEDIHTGVWPFGDLGQLRVLCGMDQRFASHVPFPLLGTLDLLFEAFRLLLQKPDVLGDWIEPFLNEGIYVRKVFLYGLMASTSAVAIDSSS